MRKIKVIEKQRNKVSYKRSNINIIVIKKTPNQTTTILTL
jgi:hypothetical protein